MLLPVPKHKDLAGKIMEFHLTQALTQDMVPSRTTSSSFSMEYYSSRSNHTEHTRTILLSTKFARERNTLEITLRRLDTTSTLETIII